MHLRRSLLPRFLTAVALAACVVPAAAGAAAPRDVWVSNVGGDSVSPFDAFTNVVGSPIAVAARPWGVAITPDGATAYVANDLSATITPIDTATKTAGAPIPVGGAPRTLGIAPDGATAYVANFDNDTVTPIDTATNTAGSPIAVGTGPHGIAIAPDGETVYVANVFSETITPIDTATRTAGAPIPVSGGPYTLAITPDGSRLYVTHLSASEVTPIDTATATAGAPIDVGGATYGIAISPDGDTAYVSLGQSNVVKPIDTATDTAGAAIPIPSSDFTEGLAVTPDGDTAYVTSIYTNSVTPIETATSTTAIPISVGASPIALAVTPNQGPVAAFGASADGSTMTFDAGASTDSDGTVASYAWNFGDGHTDTTTGPAVSHSYAQPGSYTVTLSVTDDEGCSEDFVFTGQMASCNGSPAAKVSHTVTVAAPPASHAPPTPTTQAIERFALDGRCVRRARDGRARIGLQLLLAEAGSVSVQVDRAIAAKGKRCPKPRAGRHYRGELRRVTTIDNAQTVAAASVRRRLTRNVELRPGLYRIAVRAYGTGGDLTQPAYRWVRVLAGKR